MLDPQVRQVLDTIDEMLTRNNDQSRALWDILSAIRGPDTSNQSMVHGKELTIELRQKAFPKLLQLRQSGSGHAVPGSIMHFHDYVRDESLQEAEDNKADFHFIDHVLVALSHFDDETKDLTS